MEKKRMGKMKQVLAAWLQRHAGKASLKVQKAVFLIGTVLVGCYCILLITGKGGGKLPLDPISHPVLPEADSRQALRFRVEAIHGYLDSLYQSPGGPARIDSLLEKHPGLLDSLAVWEKQVGADDGNRNGIDQLNKKHDGE